MVFLIWFWLLGSGWSFELGLVVVVGRSCGSGDFGRYSCWYFFFRGGGGGGGGVVARFGMILAMVFGLRVL